MRVLMVAAGLIVAVASLTAMWYGMRAVMGVGGACAQGGPYEIANPCPQGTVGVLTLAVPLGLAGLFLYVAGNRELPGPDLTILAWPALFLSLGYNFLEAAVQASRNDSSPVIGAICGAVFVLMGLAPLVALRSRAKRRAVFWAHETTEDAARRSGTGLSPRDALRLLSRATADDRLTDAEVAEVRHVLQAQSASSDPIPGHADEPQGSLPMFVLQLASVAIGIGIGIVASHAILG